MYWFRVRAPPILKEERKRTNKMHKQSKTGTKRRKRSRCLFSWSLMSAISQWLNGALYLLGPKVCNPQPFLLIQAGLFSWIFAPPNRQKYPELPEIASNCMELPQMTQADCLNLPGTCLKRPQLVTQKRLGACTPNILSLLTEANELRRDEQEVHAENRALHKHVEKTSEEQKNSRRVVKIQMSTGLSFESPVSATERISVQRVCLFDGPPPDGFPPLTLGLCALLAHLPPLSSGPLGLSHGSRWVAPPIPGWGRPSDRDPWLQPHLQRIWKITVWVSIQFLTSTLLFQPQTVTPHPENPYHPNLRGEIHPPNLGVDLQKSLVL